MDTNISTSEEFEKLHNAFFFNAFFSGVIDTDKGVSYDTALSKPDSKLTAAEYLLYHVNIPENMTLERMTLLSLVARIVSMYNCQTRQKRGYVANEMFYKLCHMDMDAKYAGEKSGERAIEAAKLAGAYIWRLSQINEDSDLTLIKEQWFKKAKEYGLEFNPQDEFIKEAEKIRNLGWEYTRDSTKYADMYFVRKSVDSTVSLEGLFT